MRLVRLGAETSQVGADVRAALSSWGPADAVLGGVALLGFTPQGCARPVEAVIVVPKGVLVVVGVDLPDPAVRLDAPLGAQWRADGWPLVRPDGATNPAGEALAAAEAVSQRIQHGRLAPIPVSIVVAVGPYVGQVVQPTVDLHSGVRVLYPEPKPMLGAVRELAVAERPCSVEQAGKLVALLAGDRAPMLIGELAAEGFADSVTPDLATARTSLIPRINDLTGPGRRPGSSRRPGSRSPRPRSGRRRPRWLPVGALGLLAALLIAGIAVAVGTNSSGRPAAAPPSPVAGNPTTSTDVTVGGVRFTPKNSATDTNCAKHAYGDVQVWLGQHPCAGLVRSVYATSASGRPAAVAVAVVSFNDAGTAKDFGTEANTPGSGGITDLVQDGHGWTGGPKSFDNSVYTVAVLNTVVRLTEVVWTDHPTTATDPALRSLAATAADLPNNQ